MMSELVILAESDEFPKHGLFLSKDLDQDVKRRIKEVLMNMDKDSKGISVLKEFGALKFIEADIHNDYKTVFELIQKAGIDLETFISK
jgi:ABC-type phosphate/phosphonate transport system substrate-binding protein